MAQLARVLANEPGNLSQMPGVYVAEGERQVSWIVPGLHPHHGKCVPSDTNKYKNLYFYINLWEESPMFMIEIFNVL